MFDHAANFNCYHQGYKTPSMYIAAQAPTEETSSDFWWMVWQEKSTVVVMVTNLVELGKQKCHKYWPEDRGTYGTVMVSLSSEERLSDHIVRTFILQQVSLAQLVVNSCGALQECNFASMLFRGGAEKPPAQSIVGEGRWLRGIF